MFVLFRAVTYATLFISLVLIYVPTRLLFWSGIVRPALIEFQQAAAMVIGPSGAAVYERLYKSGLQGVNEAGLYKP